MAFSTTIAYNVIATTEWIVFIPRMHQSYDGLAGTNSAGMLGFVWAADQAE
jgi:ATP adenylyltransferase/5',5'''-P-1,P-4-tetraphosphate phosphorylase II